MDIIKIKIEYLGVVIDGRVVVPQFGVAVRPVVECLDVALLSELQLLGIVIYGSLELLHLPIDEASVRVDDGIGAIKFDGLVEIMD